MTKTITLDETLLKLLAEFNDAEKSICALRAKMNDAKPAMDVDDPEMHKIRMEYCKAITEADITARLFARRVSESVAGAV